MQDEKKALGARLHWGDWSLTRKKSRWEWFLNIFLHGCCWVALKISFSNKLLSVFFVHKALSHRACRDLAQNADITVFVYFSGPAATMQKEIAKDIAKGAG